MTIYRIAIVGAGPAGYFAAQALQNRQSSEFKFAIDVFEKLPTPWGLVRSGVAPDHPKVKSVSKVFEEIAAKEGFRLLANVNVGVDITLEEIKSTYDAVVLAVGTPKGKSLGIEGEGLKNVISSADFVSWYNGHPEYRHLDVDLTGSRAIVIGAGNVAMDIGRILAIDPTELDSTDIAEHALRSLHASNIRDVYVAARRSAENVAFTSPELRELPNLGSVDVKIALSDIEEALQRTSAGAEKQVKSNLEVMHSIAHATSKGSQRRLNFVFQHVPIRIGGSKQVESISFDTANGRIELPCDLVVTAIGYLPLQFSGLQMKNGHYENQDGWIIDNLYVVGWAKRGPQGVIGTNKSDALAVMERMISRLGGVKPSLDVLSILKKRGVRVVVQSEWNQINEMEMAKGLERGTPRVKFTSVAEMLAVADHIGDFVPRKGLR
jgi:ferredoxin--NADP+ reductase